MLFNSIDFLIFFPIVVLVYLIIPKKIRYIWLLASSYYFYMCWNAKYAVLIATSTIITYAAGLIVGKVTKKGIKKLVIALGMATNLGILFVFKYFDFALLNLNKVLNLLHMDLVSNPFDIILPVGISFYTFQALGYMIDVYRGDCEAEKNILKYALFVSFFPQLVAGPIERSKNLLSQIRAMGERKIISHEKIVKGLTLMVWGLFMKMVIADRVAIFVDSIFDNFYAIGTVEGIAGAVGFAIQIYCDFGGYSAIAIGAALVMGFELMENFNTPYFALNITDFWKRWHISLSTWFRDYLYFPLGGGRCAKGRKYLNLFITFAVSGLWHGASWNYVAWGMLHGFYRVMDEVLKRPKAFLEDKLKIRTNVFSYKFLWVAITFVFTCFAWIFFRAKSLSLAFIYIRNLFTRFNPWVLVNDELFTYGLDVKEIRILLIAVLVLIVFDIIRYKKGLNPAEFLCSQNYYFAVLTFALLVVSVIIFGEYGVNFDSNQFIYFDF